MPVLDGVSREIGPSRPGGLAALSEAERARRLDRALLLAVEAHDATNANDATTTLEARNSLFRSLVAQPGLRSFLAIDKQPVSSVSFSPDGTTIAVGFSVFRVGFPGVGGIGGVVLFDATKRTRLQAEPLAGPKGWD
ncbi:MAG: hypothetical protein NVSMB9_35300 [Isosphaeraceae bacterium]